ncbi:hypothetical protein GTA51_04725 [Desulfovibrio aerotolerans]|uniref:Uncharacterized protein n=1 Tax=Solidesulfovibrio aerotolerans TaxID=295255 RepID=A0A7C9IVA4_9BACT|nr:hypothetical protein [Solidesulfovibrio aerotolerans]MYL82442.1 hypothetical protein [Solidesulfovibrio aerotolerans]
MATRSRLGRDPLQDAAKPKTPAAGRKPAKKKAAGAGQPLAPEASATPPQADDTRNLQTPETLAPVAEAAVAPGGPLAMAEVQEAAAGEPSPAAPEPAAASAAPSVLTVPSQPDALGAAFQPPTEPAAPTASESAAPPVLTVPSQPDALGAAFQPPTEPAAPTDAASAAPSVLTVPSQPDALGMAFQPPTEPAIPSVAPYAAPVASPAPHETPLAHSDAASASCEPDSLLQGEHALTLFFRSVLDAFVPDDPGALHVVVDAAAGAVPVEKILYFSHALQRIVLPTARPDQFACRPGEDCGPLPVLTARLRKGAADRHVLELFDNGDFFRNRLPQVRLGLEALKPLVTFVLGRGGSVRLAQGRCVAFEITG